MFQQADIALLDIDGQPALRDVLEELDALVLRLPLVQPALISQALHRPNGEDYLVINAHGDKQGFIIPELAPSIAAEQPFNNHLTPEIIRANSKLTGSVVVSLACATGTSSMAAAWLDGGASAYIAPTGYPEASDALVFATLLFWMLISHRASLSEAMKSASGAGGTTTMFKLYED